MVHAELKKTADAADFGFRTRKEGSDEADDIGGVAGNGEGGVRYVMG